MNAIATPRSAPIKATWICLIIAWVLFLLPIPGAGLFVGWPLNLVAFILAIVVMTRGRTAGGLIPLLASIIVSPIVYFIGLAIFGAAIGGSSYDDYKARAEAAASGTSAPASASETAPPAIAVDASKLFADYQANEVAADQAYKGQQLTVTGTVAGINKNFTDDIYVEIGTSNEFMSIHAQGIPANIAAGLQKGQKITVQCEGAGLMVGSPILSDCAVK